MNAVAKTPVKKASGLGLDAMGDLSSLLSAKPASNDASGPMLIPLSLIDEDPDQPRKAGNPGFSEESLGELAATIIARGVKTPISLRKNPEDEGRWIINHGHRRFRASILAGQDTIRAWHDPDYSDEDQVIENLQRNDLMAREVAEYIGRYLAKGEKKGDIAKKLGKSPAFVSQHITLLDLPEPLAEIFNSGRCKDVTVLNELVRAYRKNPQLVTDWLEDESMEITRSSLALMKEYLEENQTGGSDSEPDSTGGKTESGNNEGAGGPKKPRQADPSKLKKAIIQVQHSGRPARLLTDRRPSEVGLAWFKYDDDGQEFEASIGEANLVAVVEA